MKYRKLSSSGDFVFGQGPSEFLNNVPDAVAQAVKTRLALASGEWFLDLTEGTPYSTQILGMGTQNTYDQAIQQRIANTPGVKSIDAYSSNLDRDTRKLTVSATLMTIYGQTTIQQVL